MSRFQVDGFKAQSRGASPRREFQIVCSTPDGSIEIVVPERVLSKLVEDLQPFKLTPSGMSDTTKLD